MYKYQTCNTELINIFTRRIKGNNAVLSHLKEWDIPETMYCVSGNFAKEKKRFSTRNTGSTGPYSTYTRFSAYTHTRTRVYVHASVRIMACRAGGFYNIVPRLRHTWNNYSKRARERAPFRNRIRNRARVTVWRSYCALLRRDKRKGRWGRRWGRRSRFPSLPRSSREWHLYR